MRDWLGFFGRWKRILRSQVFMHSAYAAHYFGSRRWTTFALLHFLLVGERAGLRANPFIDAILLNDTGRRLRLGDYLKDDCGRTVTPSADFDPEWYASRYGGEGPIGHPFLHFWSIGFDAGMNPAPGFDLEFFKTVVAVFRPDKKEYAFERMIDGADFPRCADELTARQNAFFAQVEMKILRAMPTDRRFLVFVQAAHDYAHPFGAERSFDVLLNIYDGVPASDSASTEIIVEQNGTKTTAIRKLLSDSPDLLLHYDAVLFLDDDIDITTPDIERLLQIFEAADLDLAQSSLTQSSECSFAVLKQPAAGLGLRPISFVEIMMPLISRRALRECGAAFSASVSGWGVDALLGKMVRERFGDTIALIADVTAAHERAIDVEDGAFYRYLRRYGIEPAHEIGLVGALHGISTAPDAVFFVHNDT